MMPLLGLIVLGGGVWAYQFHPGVYFKILTALIIIPAKSPFIDAQQIPALVACARQGVDVFVTAPCDPLHRTLAYSPLWLRATFLPAWSAGQGVALVVAFCASLALLPPVRQAADLVPIGLATFSGMTIFALERGNMDVVMFILVAVAGWCLARHFGLRLAGYGCIALAGSLKFYPLVLFGWFLRENPRRFLALCAAALGLLIGFTWYFHAELREMVRNLPVAPSFTDAWGAREFPDGIERLLQWFFGDRSTLRTPAIATLHHPAAALLGLWGLIAGAVAVAWRLANDAATITAFRALRGDEKIFLVLGAALMCGCFFAGESLDYRGLHFLLLLPGLLALAAGAPGGRPLRRFDLTLWAILLIMWGQTLQMLVAIFSGGWTAMQGGSSAAYVFWASREIAWWWVISVLLAVIFRFVSELPVWCWLRGRPSLTPLP